jgi:dienelactone hydrolase
MAKNVEYAQAVQEAWEQELSENGTTSTADSVQCAPVAYQDAQGTLLYGHLVYNKAAIEAVESNNDTGNEKRLQGSILFHTGAGPQDIFLHWKAHSLVTRSNKKDNNVCPCVVLIADMVSDPMGAMGWGDDRSEYTVARDHLLQVKTASRSTNDEEHQQGTSVGTSPSTSKARPVLHSRVQAAIYTLQQGLTAQNGVVLLVSPDQISVMGWCFGGHPVLEIVRCEDLRRQVTCAVTFHGVIDGIQHLEFDNNITADDASKSAECLRLLICHGREDPFIKREHVHLYHTMLDALSGPPNPKVQWSMLEFGGVRHGFSNPAQEFNPNQKTFGYDATAARVAWDTALSILR